MEEENITFRRHKKHGNDSLDLSFESTTTEIRRCSLPDLSTAYDSDIEDLKEEVMKIKSELESAHAEIEKLNEENMTLKIALNKEKNKSENLQKICSDTKKKVINTINSKSKRKRRISRNLHFQTNELFNTSYVDLGINESNEVTTDGTSSSQTTQPILPVKISEVTSACINTTDDQQLDGVTSALRERHQEKNQRICILSSNKTNKVLPIAQSTFPRHNVCHYIYTNCGIIQLLANLDQKLLKFTKQDYCLIFIGEQDFRKTDNYFNLITSIRNILRSIQHTNILLCLPTYKFNGHCSMFNSRVETFNNLIYRDNCTHDYAIIFDSNLNLTCNETMFYRRRGVLNNYGMKNIFDNLKCYLDMYIQQNYLNIDEETNSADNSGTTLRNDKLFRL